MSDQYDEDPEALSTTKRESKLIPPDVYRQKQSKNPLLRSPEEINI